MNVPEEAAVLSTRGDDNISKGGKCLIAHATFWEVEVDGSRHTVGFDKYSMLVDGRRVVLWSGEVHPFRLPSPSLWRDVLEKLRAQKRALDSRVDLATIVLSVSPSQTVPVPVDTSSHLPGFLDGLAAGWRAFVSTLTVVLVALGALLPFAPVVGAVLAGAWWWRRRTRPAPGTA